MPHNHPQRRSPNVFAEMMLNLKASMIRENKWLATLPVNHRTAYKDKTYHRIDLYKPRYRKIVFDPEQERFILINLSDSTAFSSNCGAFENAQADSESDKIKSGLETVSMIEKCVPAQYEEEMKNWFVYHMHPFTVENVSIITELADPVYDVVYEFDDTTNGYILEESLESYYEEVEENDRRRKDAQAEEHESF